MIILGLLFEYLVITDRTISKILGTRAIGGMSELGAYSLHINITYVMHQVHHTH